MAKPEEPNREPAEEQPAERPPAFSVVQLLAVITMVLGAILVIQAVRGGGGPGSYGVLIGALFFAAGLMRLRYLRGRR
jgi:ABC-type Na+ efflux pump permease subunit